MKGEYYEQLYYAFGEQQALLAERYIWRVLNSIFF